MCVLHLAFLDQRAWSLDRIYRQADETRASRPLGGGEGRGGSMWVLYKYLLSYADFFFNCLKEDPPLSPAKPGSPPCIYNHLSITFIRTRPLLLKQRCYMKLGSLPKHRAVTRLFSSVCQSVRVS